MIPVIIFLIIINWLRYERSQNIVSLQARWGAEDEGTKKKKGIWLTLSLTLVILFPILVGVLKHNLGVL